MILSASLIDSLERVDRPRKENLWNTIWFRFLFLCGLGLFFVSCASMPDKHYSYLPSANAGAEIQKLQEEVAQAEKQQMGILAPESFPRAKKSLERADSLQSRGSSNEKVLEELGEARSYFEQAKSVSAISRNELSGIVEARQKALDAGAWRFERKELNAADRKLTRLANQIEDKDRSLDLSVDERADLQKRYMDLEVRAVKSAYLGDAQSRIRSAKKMGAKRFAPRTLESAESKLRSAEMTIEADRGNPQRFSGLAAQANTEAQRLQKVTDLSRRSGGSGNEPLAVAVVNRDERIESINRQREQEAYRAKMSEEQMKAQEQRLRQEQEMAQRSASEAQQSADEAQRALQSQQQVEQAYTEAQNSFTPEEAQVFRQGDRLILRMRSVTFSSGRADIPPASFATLNKVRDVAQKMKAQQIIVQGHTDSTGSADINMEVSRRRADVVAQYLRSQFEDRRLGGVEETEMVTPSIEARGFGYQQPVSSNKTKQGRALNRRVDIVISPSVMNDEASPAAEDAPAAN